MPENAPTGESNPWMVEHLKRRRWPLVVMLTFVIVSMAYSLWWNRSSTIPSAG